MILVTELGFSSGIQCTENKPTSIPDVKMNSNWINRGAQHYPNKLYG